MPTFSLHARRALEARRNAKLLAKLAREDGAPVLERPAKPQDAADGRTLRGIPAIGRGVDGAIPGTKPGG